jgi:hypothetical protein
MGATILLILAVAEAAASPPPAAPPPQEIAPGIELLRGAILPERGPDGNTLVFDAPQGLVVVDTGRHTWHSDAILAYAKSRNRPVAAIINTHWHLDHTSGNGPRQGSLSRARGCMRRTRSTAVLADGGFLRATSRPPSRCWTTRS